MEEARAQRQQGHMAEGVELCKGKVSTFLPDD